MEPALKLDRLAQLRAELEAGAAQAELLEREKLSDDSWRGACAYWDAKLAEEAAQHRFVLGNRYNTAFNVKRRLLAAKRKPAAPEPEPEVTAPPAPEPAQQPAPEVTPPPTAAPRAAPLPLPPVMAPLPAPETGFARPSLGEEPPVLARAPDAHHAPPRADLGGTMIGNEPIGRPPAAAMPFQRSAARATGIQVHAGRSALADPRSNVDGSTVTLDNPARAGGQALPFLEAARAARAGAKPVEPAALPPPLPDYSGTLTIDPTSADGAAALPFMAALREQRLQGERREGGAPRRFSLEQFAALTAQIAVAPEAIAEVRQRWGLTEASHRSESEAWQQACAADPPLFQRYAALVKQLRTAAKAGR